MHTGCVESGHLDPWEWGADGTLANRNGPFEDLIFIVTEGTWNCDENQDFSRVTVDKK